MFVGLILDLACGCFSVNSSYSKEINYTIGMDNSYPVYFQQLKWLITLYELVEEPDLGHYGVLSELKLGHLFGVAIINNI